MTKTPDEQLSVPLRMKDLLQRFDPMLHRRTLILDGHPIGSETPLDYTAKNASNGENVHGQALNARSPTGA